MSNRTARRASRYEYTVRQRGKSYNVFAGAWKTAEAAREWIENKSANPGAYDVVRRAVGEWEVVS